MKRAVVAKRLGVTQAAVTQYFKAVRGTRNKALINENFSDLIDEIAARIARGEGCILYTSPSPRDRSRSRMVSSA